MHVEAVAFAVPCDEDTLAGQAHIADIVHLRRENTLEPRIEIE